MAHEQGMDIYGPDQQRRSEIYTYEAPWLIYGMNWSVRKDKLMRLAIGSFIEDFRNKVEIVQLDDETCDFKADPKLSFEHPYPTTKIMFIPDKDCQKPDLLATTGDFLRIWQVRGSLTLPTLVFMYNHHRLKQLTYGSQPNLWCLRLVPARHATAWCCLKWNSDWTGVLRVLPSFPWNVPILRVMHASILPVLLSS